LRGSPGRETLQGRQLEERTWQARNLKRARGSDLELILQGSIKEHGFLDELKPMKLR